MFGKKLGSKIADGRIYDLGPFGVSALDDGDLDNLDLQQVYQDLKAAFQTFSQMQLPSETGQTGLILVQVEAMGGLIDEALKTLDAMQELFEQTRQKEGLQAVVDLRDRIEGRSK